MAAQIQISIDTSVLLMRAAFASVALVALVVLMPQLALSFGDVNCGIGRYAFTWPQRAFPSGFHSVYGDMYLSHLDGAAFVLAVNFWIVLSVIYIYLTKALSFRLYAAFYVVGVLLTEVIFTLALKVTPYVPDLGYSYCAP